jgi:hypothetical protein
MLCRDAFFFMGFCSRIDLWEFTIFRRIGTTCHDDLVFPYATIADEMHMSLSEDTCLRVYY